MSEPGNACLPSSRDRIGRPPVAAWLPGRSRLPAQALRAALAAGVLLAAGCGGHEPSSAFGEPVDRASAVPLATLLSGASPDASGSVAVSGRIGEVCRSAGCWFVLQDGEKDALVEILVDLERTASFTVPASVQGRRAIVRGRLVGEGPDLQFNAVGMLLE